MEMKQLLNKLFKSNHFVCQCLIIGHVNRNFRLKFAMRNLYQWYEQPQTSYIEWATAKQWI